MYALEHFNVQLGRFPRHQGVAHWEGEISEWDKQSKQLIVNRRHHFERRVKVQLRRRRQQFQLGVSREYERRSLIEAKPVNAQQHAWLVTIIIDLCCL